MRRAVAAAAAVLACAGCRPSLPTDAALIAALADHRAAFEQSRDAALRSGETRIEAATLTRFAPDDQEKLREVLDEVGVKWIDVARTPQGERIVGFVVHSSGIATGGTVKQIEWRNRPLPPHARQLASLDDPSDRRGLVTPTWFNAHRPLGGGWYLSLSKN